MIVLFCVVIAAVAGLIYLHTNTSTPQQSGNDTIVLEKTGVVYEMDLVTKELKPYVSPTDGFKTFAGLPKEEDNSQVSIKVWAFLLSADKTKVIVVSPTFDNTQQPSGFDGSLPILRASEFMCTIATKKCTTTDSLEVAYKKVFGDTDQWFNFNMGMLSWYEWDSQKNLLFGHLSGEGIGNVSPVYIFNLNTRTLQQTLGYDSLNTQEKRAEVPEGAFGPLLDKFVMVHSTANTTSLLLYSSTDLTAPQKTYDISSTMDATAEEVRSVGWSADENSIVLSTTNQIYTFNLETGERVLRYTDPTDSLYDSVRFSSSERYIVFVNDLKQTYDGNPPTVLRTIDLQNNNKINNVLVENGIGLYIP